MAVQICGQIQVQAKNDRQNWLLQPEDYIYARIFQSIQRRESPAKILVSESSLEITKEDLDWATQCSKINHNTILAWAKINQKSHTLGLAESDRVERWKRATAQFDPLNWDPYQIKPIPSGLDNDAMASSPDSKGVLHLSRVGRFEAQALVKFTFQTETDCIERIRLYEFTPKFNGWLEIRLPKRSAS